MGLAARFCVGMVVALVACRTAPQPIGSGGWGTAAFLRPSAVWIRAEENQVEVPGPLSSAYADQVYYAVSGAYRGFQRCYEGLLERQPSLDGEIWVLFRVEADGRVLEAEADFSTVAGPELERCVLERFLTLRMPEPPGPGYRVRIPLVFTSPGTPPEVLGALEQRYHLEREPRENDKKDSSWGQEQKPEEERAPW